MPADVVPVVPQLSFARRDGDDIVVDIALAEGALPPGAAFVRFLPDEGEAVRTEAEVTDDDRLRARIDAARLGTGSWRLKVRSKAASGGPRPLRTRLLVSDDQPVALLPPFTDDVVGT